MPAYYWCGLALAVGALIGALGADVFLAVRQWRAEQSRMDRWLDDVRAEQDREFDAWRRQREATRRDWA